MGSDESHFNVSLIVRHKVTRQFPQTTTFEEKGEPKRNRTEVLLQYQPNALPLGQSGSLRSFFGRLLGLDVHRKPDGLSGMGKKGAVVGVGGGGYGTYVMFILSAPTRKSKKDQNNR